MFKTALSSLYEHLFHLNETYRYSMTGMLFMLFAVLWYFFIYHPVHNILIERDAYKNKQVIEFEALKKTQHSSHELIQKIDSHNRDITHTLQELTPISFSVDSIKKLAKESAMELVAFTKLRKENHRLFFAQIYECRLRGTYRQLISFFKGLEQLSNSLKIVSCEIKKNNKFLESVLELSFITKRGKRA